MENRRGKFQVEKKESETKKMEKKCPHCGGPLRFRGPKDCVGAMYWKCRDKKCGRTVTLKKDFVGPAIPLVYVSRQRGFNG